MVHLKKFAVRPDWTSVKLDVAVEMPDTLDLSFLRGHGLQSTETVLPEATTAPPTIAYDQALLRQLAEMGFPPEACKRALYFTENGGIEVASSWLMEHISDEDFSSPFVPPGVDAGAVAGKFKKFLKFLRLLFLYIINHFNKLLQVNLYQIQIHWKW